MPTPLRNFSAGARVLVLSLVLVVLSTGCKEESVPAHKKENAVRADTPTDEMMRLLAADPVACGDDMVAAAVSLRDHLAKMNIELCVALLPNMEAVMRETSPGSGPSQCVPQQGWTQSGALLADAESKLKAKGVPVCNLLRPMHADFLKYPDRPLYREPIHLNHLGVGAVGRGVAKWAEWPREDQKESGSGVDASKEKASQSLWVGDCHITLYKQYLESKGYGVPKVFWRNASSNQMAKEVSLLEPSYFEGVRRVVWILGSVYIEKMKFPPVVTGPRPPVEGKICVGTIVKPSQFPEDLGPKSPYPDAITVIEFEDERGEPFMGMAYAMNNRVVDYVAHRQWTTGRKLRLTLKPWDQMRREKPELANIRQLDDQTNYEAPRYWITYWHSLD